MMTRTMKMAKMKHGRRKVGDVSVTYQQEEAISVLSTNNSSQRPSLCTISQLKAGEFDLEVVAIANALDRIVAMSQYLGNNHALWTHYGTTTTLRRCCDWTQMLDQA